MKKEILYYSILLIIISSLLFFETEFFQRGPKIYSRIIDIESFEKLDIDLACNIYVSIGEEQKIVFEGPKKYIDLVEATLENGVLKISAKEGGIFAGILRTNDQYAEALNLYINLTDANQLLTPKKGNLISNETSLYLEWENPYKIKPAESIRRIFQALENHLGYIMVF